MDIISEEYTEATAAAAANGQLEDSRRRSKELAIQKLLKILDENAVVIDDHLRRSALGQNERSYTSNDADESLRRSSSLSAERRHSSSSLLRGNLINRSRRKLSSVFLRKHSSVDVVESAPEKELSSETDSSVSSTNK